MGEWEDGGCCVRSGCMGRGGCCAWSGFSGRGDWSAWSRCAERWSLLCMKSVYDNVRHVMHGVGVQEEEFIGLVVGL